MILSKCDKKPGEPPVCQSKIVDGPLSVPGSISSSDRLEGQRASTKTNRTADEENKVKLWRMRESVIKLDEQFSDVPWSAATAATAASPITNPFSPEAMARNAVVKVAVEAERVRAAAASAPLHRRPALQLVDTEHRS
jgi:hypothetical protein